VGIVCAPLRLRPARERLDRVRRLPAVGAVCRDDRRVRGCRPLSLDVVRRVV